MEQRCLFQLLLVEQQLLVKNLRQRLLLLAKGRHREPFYKALLALVVKIIKSIAVFDLGKTQKLQHDKIEPCVKVIGLQACLFKAQEEFGVAHVGLEEE